MRVVVQRVTSATVFSSGEIVGQVKKGLLILLGVGQEDTPEKVENMAEKILKMRIMSDKQDKMNLSVADVGAEILVVSQFTLFADTSGGNRPSFIKAAAPNLAKQLYERFIELLKVGRLRVENGSFGNYMEIEAKLDGPVTITLEN